MPISEARNVHSQCKNPSHPLLMSFRLAKFDCMRHSRLLEIESFASLIVCRAAADTSRYKTMSGHLLFAWIEPNLLTNILSLLWLAPQDINLIILTCIFCYTTDNSILLTHSRPNISKYKPQFLTFCAW